MKTTENGQFNIVPYGKSVVAKYTTTDSKEKQIVMEKSDIGRAFLLSDKPKPFWEIPYLKYDRQPDAVDFGWGNLSIDKWDIICYHILINKKEYSYE